MENLIDKMPIIIVLLNWHRNMSCHFYEYKSKSVQPKPPEESESSHFLYPFYKGLWGIGFAKIFLGTII